MSDGCVFCKIVAGELPCAQIYDSEQILSFLDIGPVTPGHCLIVPKVHADRLELCDAAILSELGKTIGLIGKAVMQVITCSGEMRRYRKEHQWRRRHPGPILTLRCESVGSKQD